MDPEENLALRENYDIVSIVYVVIKVVCALYKEIVVIFGHIVSYFYIEVPMEKGYSELSQKIRVSYIHWSKPDKNCKNLANLAEYLCKTAGIDPQSKYYKQIYRDFENANIRIQKFGKKDFLFGNEQGQATYFFIYMEANVKLSSNILIERKEEHWGIWRDKTSKKIIEKPSAFEKKILRLYFLSLIWLL